MLSRQDDFLGHQPADRIRSRRELQWSRAATSSYIRLGRHPNRNVMDGFAGVAFRGKQYNVRVSRRLRPNPLGTAIGPLELRGSSGPSADLSETGGRGAWAMQR